MRLAIATCANLPTWEVDDKPFHADLAERGVSVTQIAWDRADARWEAFDACLIRTTWDYQERRDDFVAWAGRVPRLWNPAPVVRWNTHKSYLRELESRGVPIVPTVWLDRGTRADVRSLLRWPRADVRSLLRWPRGFIKPCVGSTARETLRFDDPAVAQRHVDRLLPREDLMLQPYLARVETEGELSAIFIDGGMTHAVRKIPVAGDYRVQDDFGAKDEPWRPTADEAALARRVVEAAPEDLLYARVDFLRDDAGALCVTELELVEPSLFFRHARHAATKLADAVARRLRYVP